MFLCQCINAQKEAINLEPDITVSSMYKIFIWKKCGDLEKVKSVCGLSSRVLSDVGGGGGGGSGNIV